MNGFSSEPSLFLDHVEIPGRRWLRDVKFLLVGWSCQKKEIVAVGVRDLKHQTVLDAMATIFRYTEKPKIMEVAIESLTGYDGEFFNGMRSQDVRVLTRRMSLVPSPSEQKRRDVNMFLVEQCIMTPGSVRKGAIHIAGSPWEPQPPVPLPKEEATTRFYANAPRALIRAYMEEVD